MLALTLLALPVATMAARTLPRDELHEDVLSTIAEYKKKDPGIKKFFDDAIGYAVFPAVGKGAVGIGAAHGSGELIVGGKAVGMVKLNQVTVGLQFGGQSYSEIIFFNKQNTLDSFRHSDFSFAAQVSAIALTAGASANAAYRDGVAVFTEAEGGLMYEASIGGQKFSYTAY